MPRQLRLDYPGAWHHVMHRGARREPIFRDDDDATTFFDALQEAVERFRLEVHAYSLMPNHYHLLVRSPHATLSRAMRHVNGVFTQRLNKRCQWDGPIFRGRFASQLVERDEHLELLVAYLHLNPVRAHLVARPDDECWTSHRAYLGLETPRPWLTRDEMLARFGSGEALHRYVLDIHEGSMPWPEGFDTEDGWMPRPDSEPERRDRPPSQGPLDVDEVMARVGRVTGSDRKEILCPKSGPGANPARRFAVWALRRSTLLSQAQIGKILGMRAPHVARVLAAVGRNPPGPLVTWMQAWDGQDAVGDGE